MYDLWSIEVPYGNSGSSPFIITCSIYSMKTGSPYVILQSRMLPLTRRALLFDHRENICVFFKVWLKYHYYHSISYCRTESILSYFFCIHSLVCMSYRSDHIVCSILIYRGSLFSRLSRRETRI